MRALLLPDLGRNGAPHLPTSSAHPEARGRHAPGVAALVAARLQRADDVDRAAELIDAVADLDWDLGADLEGAFAMLDRVLEGERRLGFE